MSETENIRWERIQRLFKELEYEVTRGMLENDIEEEIGFQFYVPISRKIPNGIVQCEFRTRPTFSSNLDPYNFDHRLRLIGKKDSK